MVLLYIVSYRVSEVTHVSEVIPIYLFFIFQRFVSHFSSVPGQKNLERMLTAY